MTHLIGPPSAMNPDVDADPAAIASVRSDADGPAARARRGIVFGASATLIVWLASDFDSSILWASLVFVPGGVAAAIDDATGALPDPWVLATAAGGLAWVVLDTGATGPLGWSLAALAVAVPLGVLHTLAPAAMGFGDVKFAAAIGGSLAAVTSASAERLALAMVMVAVASGAALAYGVVRRRQSVPFGPCLLLGGGIATVLAMRGAITT